jgi:hypothetical protein
MVISGKDATWQCFSYPARMTAVKTSHTVPALANPDPEPAILACFPRFGLTRNDGHFSHYYEINFTTIRIRKT